MTMPRIGLLAAIALSGLHLACEMNLGAQSRYPVRDTQTVTRTLRFDGSGTREVDVRTLSGSIRVVASNRSDVSLEAVRTVRARSADDLETANREVRIDFMDGASSVGAVVRTNGITCGESSSRDGWRGRPRYEVDYAFTLEVPRRVELRLCTINGEAVTVDGTEGDFEVDNVNGGITLRNMRGSGTAETINGDLVASFADAPRADSFLKTLNGNLDATFPASLSADLLMKTFNGDLWTDFDVQVLPQKPAQAERRNGGFVYRSDGSARVRVGTGGPELRLETFNGDVRVLRGR
jgi:DUF4097 and DUF4098 domain-containing protein YvlB